MGCVHVYTNGGHLRAAKGKRERREEGLFADPYSCFFWNHTPRPLFSFTCLCFISLFSGTARVRLSLYLSHVYLSVSTCLLLISSFIAFLFTCLRLSLLLHGSNWEFEIECYVSYFHRPLKTVAVIYVIPKLPSPPLLLSLCQALHSASA